MLRYVIALFLINTYSQILGAPALQAPSHTITDYLNSLANNCENPFIKAQIENSLQNCSITVIDHKRLFECIIFYDINNQLCSAINNSKITIEEDFSAQINQVLDVKNLCDSAKGWTFNKNYDLKVNLSTVFQDPVKCEKFCGVDDLFSTDSKFFCKYYNWGWQKLNPEPIVKTDPKFSSSGAMPLADVSLTTGAAQSNISIKTPDTPANVPSVDVDPNESADFQDIEVPVPPKTTKTETNMTTNLVPVTAFNSSVSSLGDTMNSQPQLNTDNILSIEKTPTSLKNNVSSTAGQSQLEKVDSGSSKQAEETADENLDVGNEADADDDDNEDGEIVDNPASMTKEIRISGDFSQKEFYTPDLTPEDDHFFPFFLTAIILVVLLYVLYHNKGRVTKVLLGLIVEGRQNGRRRSSRGHAYRRLDTLEQAMSGNLSAQPSKIIY